MIIGRDKLRAALKEDGRTYNEIGHAVGDPGLASTQKFLSGERRMRITLAVQLASVLPIPINVLLTPRQQRTLVQGFRLLVRGGAGTARIAKEAIEEFGDDGYRPAKNRALGGKGRSPRAADHAKV